jgi:hypothetical protein
MTMDERSHILCAQLASFAPVRWKSVRAAFSGAAPCELAQAWRASPEERFQPGCVRAGWQEDAIWIFAELADAAIVSHENQFNEPAFLTGDVFEIFLRPAGQAAYCEFHVTPHNGRMQLRYPDGVAVEEVRRAIEAGAPDPFAPFKVTRELFQSWTHIDEAAQHWEVLARIPLRSLVEAEGDEIPMRFDCSFCRYDYAPGIPEPVISSSSPHREPNFHRQGEWAELCLV